MDEWKGPGEIECRDVGPCKCLITFDSSEIRNEAFQNELLIEIFDEVRPHWELFWSSSKRIWLEMMGMPVSLWSTENFAMIAKMWVKWERVHEWVNVKVEDRTFEVFVKKFGSEVYSVNSHPDLVSVSESSDFSPEENGDGGLKVEEMPVGVNVEPVEVEVVSTQLRMGNEKLKVQVVLDPLIEEIIKNKLINVQELNMERKVGGEEWDMSTSDDLNQMRMHGPCYIRSVRLGLLGFDPVTHEAQITTNTTKL
ncbi:hypothetical protein PIB30_035457 [Stylosanthes scabra]|uniref:DUF4283 domain-containing protein n=1 Tax=Stylosanthes scabra TaxID=79078 RepID=A0ABU6UCZ0_9FABA|nr:hypothetical protein [Stylosanthes scabra]